MTRWTRLRRAAVLVVALLVVSACNRGGDESVETTSTPTAVTTSSAASVATTATTEGGGDTTTATTVAIVVGMPSYRVLEAADAEADSLIVVVEPGSYTNVELENLVFDIVDRFAPASAVVVDLQEAADLLLLDELDAAQQTFLAEHTVLQIEDGVEVTFLGPYSDLPALTIGS